MARKEEIHPVVERLLSGAAGSIEELAGEIGVAYATLYGWATGRRKPSQQHLLAMAEIADRRADLMREVAGDLRALGKGEVGGQGEPEHPGPGV